MYIIFLAVVPITHSPARVFYDNYDNIVLVCSIMGHGQTQLQWKYQGTPIVNELQSMIQTNESSRYGPIRIITSFLSLCPSQQNDPMVNGEYTCEGLATIDSAPTEAPGTIVCSKPGK